MGGWKYQALEFEASLGDGGNSIWPQDSSTGNLVIAFMAVTLDGAIGRKFGFNDSRYQLPVSTIKCGFNSNSLMVDV